MSCVSASADNSIVRNSSNPRTASTDVALLDLPKDERVASVVQQYVTASAPLASRVIGSVTQDILNQPNNVGEMPSGDVIADAQLVATTPPSLGGAQIAFMNPGGIRGGNTFGFLFAPSGAEQPGEVTYGEAFTIQPFGNSLVTKTMTGARSICCSSSSSSAAAARRRSGSCRSRPGSPGRATPPLPRASTRSRT